MNKKSTVYFIPMQHNEGYQSAKQKLESLYEACDLGACYDAHDTIAIKMHFGEKGNANTIPPEYVKILVEKLKEKETSPFLTDTCVLYKSMRSDAVNHLILARDQGYSLDTVGAPVIIADGLLGTSEIDVNIPGELFKTVAIAANAIMSNAMLVLTHITGHMATALGGALKNLGMGFASRKGKLRQHSGMKPKVKADSCTGCEQCVKWCPENAIIMRGDIAIIDSGKCIGCGQCLSVCRFFAIAHNWAVDSATIQKKVAEHAYGAVIDKPNKVGYLNFITAVTKNCDCISSTQNPIIPDIGVIASKDPVAIDAASLKLIHLKTGKKLSQMSFPHLDYSIQLRHAEKIGLGKTNFEIIEI
ncbi:DUF362 domain-containing protein [candidate division KSB1 bacterium]|nr:DUF362 domain-containing protein [candidate division KSB1 bacterium]